MVILEKEKLEQVMLPGRVIAKAVGAGSASESARMTVGFADYHAAAGPMEPHNHAEETVYVICSDRGYVRFGDEKDRLGGRIPLRAGMLLHIPAWEWHVFEYDEGGRVEILFIYGQADDIRPEEKKVR
jgi:mannose-6-phosphate isomerase-like protein (cupin superfamily)